MTIEGSENMDRKNFRKARRRVEVSVGESVRIIRELQGLSQNGLSEITGIPQSTLSAIENDRVNLGVERAKVLARALRVIPRSWFSRDGMSATSPQLDRPAGKIVPSRDVLGIAQLVEHQLPKRQRNLEGSAFPRRAFFVSLRRVRVLRVFRLLRTPIWTPGRSRLANEYA